MFCQMLLFADQVVNVYTTGWEFSISGLRVKVFDFSGLHPNHHLGIRIRPLDSYFRDLLLSKPACIRICPG